MTGGSRLGLLEAGAEREIKLVALLINMIVGQGNTEIEAQRGSPHEEAKSDAEIIVVVRRVEVVGAGIDEARVIKNREPDGFNDVERVFGGEHAIGLAADRLAGRVARTDVAFLEAAQIIGSAQEPAVVKGHLGALAEILDHPTAGDQTEHLGLGPKHRDEFRSCLLYTSDAA